MIIATIIITVKYAPDADMEEATNDKRGFEREIRNYFGHSIADPIDLHVDHYVTKTEVPYNNG